MRLPSWCLNYKVCLLVLAIITVLAGNFALAADDPYYPEIPDSAVDPAPFLSNPVNVIVSRIMTVILVVLGSLAVGVIVYTGISLMFQGGDKNKREKLIKGLFAAIIGLVIVVCAYAIVQVVGNLTTGTTPAT